MLNNKWRAVRALICCSPPFEARDGALSSSQERPALTSSGAGGIPPIRRKACRGSRKSSRSRARQNALRGASRRLKVETARRTESTQSLLLRHPQMESLRVAGRAGVGGASLGCSRRHHPRNSAEWRERL